MKIAFANGVQNSFPSELARLIEELINNSESSTYALRDILIKALPITKSIEPTPKSIEEIEEDNLAYISSDNTDAKINSLLNPKQGLPTQRGPFDLRILSMPRAVVEQIKVDISKNEPVPQTNPQNNPLDDSFPSRTTLELDGKILVKLLPNFRSGNT